MRNGNGELAITVARGYRGWLGPFLLDVLLESSRERGFPNLEADVLFMNSRMLALLRARGYATIAHEGFSSSRVVVSTAGRVPTWSPQDPRRRVLVEAPGGRWSAEADAKKAGLQVIVCAGPKSRLRSPCPALVGQPCPLAAEADAIVFHLDPADEAAVLEAHAVQRRRSPCPSASSRWTNRRPPRRSPK